MTLELQMDARVKRGRPRLVRLSRRGRPRQIRPAALHGVLVKHLRELIQNGELAPGERIVEKDLSEEIGVSRTPLREALKVLSSEGLIELRPHRTPIVAPVDADEIAAIFEILESLEALAGRKAAENATPDDIDQLTHMQNEFEKLHDNGDRLGYVALNQKIHARIVELAGNPVLVATYDTFTVKIQRARATANYDAKRWLESTKEHARITEAFRSGTPADVAEALVDHMRRTGKAAITMLRRLNAANDSDTAA